MNKLFLHHRYVDLPTRDVSGNGNDGVGHDLSPGTRPFDGTVGFNGSTSWIEVPYSESMDNLGQFQGRVVFRVDPGTPANRLNLVEGFVSFAIAINTDRSVSFTIVDRNGQWSGCTSAPGRISADVWHTLSATHDGVSEARIVLGTEVVARATDVLGPVRSIGQRGIAIGRWPDAPQFQFRGYLSEVALYKYDPIPDLNFMLGAPCVDTETVDMLIRRMVNRVGVEKLIEWARALHDILLQVAQAVQAGEADTDEYRKQVAAMVIALGNRDKAAFGDTFNAHRKRTWEAVRDAQYDQLRTRFVELARQMPLTDDERLELAKALCIDQLAGAVDDNYRERGGRHVRR